jgi:eukaryotic-like serine/threonine-protein kinase
MTPECPAQIGIYRIEGVLGRGGCGVVYRARNPFGASTALKVASGGDGATRSALVREMEALGRLAHPGVIRIRERHVDVEPPHYAMELIEGPTLRRWAQRLRDGSPPQPRLAHAQAVVACMAQLCDTLEYVHAEGLVHRDLQPDNILMRDDRAPVLVDFGLASQTPGARHREILISEGEAAGQLPYLAPEVVRGEMTDGRADLYAIGCMLYELLLGRAPFVGRPHDVLSGHLNDPPPAPSSLQPGFPAPLEAIVLRLLGKDPAARFGYAAEAAAALRAWEATGTTPAQATQSPTPRRFLHRAGLIGRDDEMARLGQHLDRAAAGQGGIVALLGPSGVGKTRLLLELNRRASARGFAVLAGACSSATAASGDGGGAGVPLEPLREPLRAVADQCRERGIAETHRVYGAHGRLLGPFVPGLELLPGQAEHPVPACLPPDAHRQRIVEALADVFVAVAHDVPVLLLLDDLQWADDLSLAWLGYLARTQLPRRNRLLLVVAARDEASQVVLRDLLAEPAVTHEPIAPLGAPQVERLVQALVGGAHSNPFALTGLLALADGNPFFVTEYLQLAINNGIVPASMRQLMRLRLRHLSPRARGLAEILAVLGRDAPESVVAALLDDGGALDRVVLDELASWRVIEGHASGLRFAHDGLREAAYQEMEDARRSSLHRAAGQLLQARITSGGAPARLASVPQIARHYLAGGDLDRALDFFEQAATEALAIDSNREAASYLGEALAAAETTAVAPARRARWLRQLGTAQNALGLIDQSRTSFADALALLGHPFPTHPRGLLLGAARQIAARSWLLLRRRLGAGGPATTDPVLEEALHSHQGVGYLLSDGRSVLYNCAKMLTLAERANSPAMLTRAHATMGLAMGLLPWSDAAEHFFRRSRAAALLASDPESESWALLVEGYYGLGQGALSRARMALLAAESIARRTGEHRRREETLVLLCDTEILRWNPAAAIALCEQVLASARARGDRQTQLWALANQARTLLQLGESAAALECLAAASVLVESTVPSDKVLLEGLLGLAHLESGASDQALVHAQEASRRIGAAQTAIYYTTYGCWGAAETLLRLAGASAGAARSRLLVTASVCTRSLRQHARLHPVAWPRYWLVEGLRRRITGQRGADLAFERARLRAQRLALPFETALAARGADE